MNESIDPLQYGMLLQKVDTMEKELYQLRQDMHKLLELANRSRGGFWAGMVFVSIVSSIAGFFISLMGKSS